MSNSASRPEHASNDLTTDGPYSGPSAENVASARSALAAAGYGERPTPYIPATWRNGMLEALPPEGSAERPFSEFEYVPDQDEATSHAEPLSVAETVAVGEPAELAASRELAAFAEADVEAETLPWINAFMPTTPSGSPAVVSEVESAAPELNASEVPHAEVPHAGDDVQEDVQEPDVVGEKAAVDEWPLHDVGGEMRALAEEIRAHDQVDLREPSSPLFDAPPHVDPLPMWNDEDMIDIMPINRMAGHLPPVERGSGDQWADRARQSPDHEAVSASHAEAAARTLEALAQRVRDGELTLPYVEPQMSDAAALAAALAALLRARP